MLVETWVVKFRENARFEHNMDSCGTVNILKLVKTYRKSQAFVWNNDLEYSQPIWKRNNNPKEKYRSLY